MGVWQIDSSLVLNGARGGFSFVHGQRSASGDASHARRNPLSSRSLMRSLIVEHGTRLRINMNGSTEPWIVGSRTTFIVRHRRNYLFM